MAKLTLAHIEHLSQHLSDRYKTLNDLMSQAWLDHELARETLRRLIKAHDRSTESGSLTKRGLLLSKQTFTKASSPDTTVLSFPTKMASTRSIRLWLAPCTSADLGAAAVMTLICFFLAKIFNSSIIATLLASPGL